MVAVETLSPEKREQILIGAATVFAQEGYEGASMSRIAAQANVSKGTLYNHFEGKAQLFSAYIEMQTTRKLSHIFSAVDSDAEPAEILRGIGQRMVHMLASPDGLTTYRVVVSAAEKFPELARMFYDAGPARAIEHLASWLSEQTKRGLLAVPDPVFAAEQFFALCQTRLAMRCRLMLTVDTTPCEIERIVDAAVAMFLRTYSAQ
jgi:TetR/AcrR family transcriptional repressor of mexJK operon